MTDGFLAKLTYHYTVLTYVGAGRFIKATRNKISPNWVVADFQGGYGISLTKSIRTTKYSTFISSDLLA